MPMNSGPTAIFLPITTKFGPRSVMNIISRYLGDGMSRNINNKKKVQNEDYKAIIM